MKTRNKLLSIQANIILIIGFWLLGIRTSLTQWIKQNSSTSLKLNDVIILDAQTAITVGDSGLILKTTNGGQNWNPKFAHTGVQWNAIAFANITEGIVLGIV